MFCSQVRGLSALALAALISACGETYQVEVELQPTPFDLDLSGAEVMIDGEQHMLKQGRYAGDIQRSPGARVPVSVKLPKHLTSERNPTEVTFTLDAPSAGGAIMKLVVPVQKKLDANEMRYLVEVSDGCAGQKVSFNGEPAGAVDDEGTYTRTFTGTKGKVLIVVLEEAANCLEQRCSFELSTKDRLVVDDLCELPADEDPPGIGEHDSGATEEEEEPRPDAEVSDRGRPMRRDAGEPADARPADARPSDARPTDARPTDASPRDAGQLDSTVRDGGVVYPDAAVPQPEGTVAVRVLCTPPGLMLYVDEEPLLTSCAEGNTVFVKPGARAFRLEPRAGGEPCPGAKPIIAVIAKKGPKEVTVSADCAVRSCVVAVRDSIPKNSAVSERDIACLTAVPLSSADFVEARILLSHVYDAKKKDLKRAEEVLTALIETPKGSNVADAYYRLADLVGRRKNYEEQSRYAEQAWALREQFANAKDGKSRILGTRKLRAAAAEGLFYAREESTTYFTRALSEYTILETEALREGANNDGEMWLKAAREGKARLEDYQRGSKTTLGK